MKRILQFGLAVLLLPSGLLAWSTKEHILTTRLAVLALLADPTTPEPLREWLVQAAPGLGDMEAQREFLLRARIGAVPRGVDGLAFWAVMPDMQALLDRPGTVVEPFGVHEKLLHYIDLEYFLPGSLPASTQPAAADAPELLAASASAGDVAATRPAAAPDSRPDPSNKPAATNIPRGYDDPRFARSGMLPHRVDWCYRKLMATIAEGRLADKPGRFPRDEHAVRYAGVLAHYLQDGTQPHHSTIDYKSRSFFPPGLRDKPDVHAMVEYRPVDDEFDDYPDLRQAYWDALVAELQTIDVRRPFADPFAVAMESSLSSYDHLPLIGQAAVHAWAAAGGEATGSAKVDLPAFYAFRLEASGPSVLEMKARQQAKAVELTARAIRSAWTAHVP